MKLAIVGYGKMGRMIEQLAPRQGLTVVARIDAGDDLEPARGADVAIEFTAPDAAVDNLARLAALGVPTVCGTTGWFHRLVEVTAAVDRHQTALVWSPNFSIGVNVFQRVVAETSRLLASEDYDAWAWEIHHNQKKDAPSGTLIKLVEQMNAGGWRKPVDTASNRAGHIPGTHEIGFDSAADTITLRHTARSREGFARGALKAALWIPGKRGVFEFTDVLFGRNS